MCNLYSVTNSQSVIRELAEAMVDHAGNTPSLPGILPNWGQPWRVLLPDLDWVLPSIPEVQNPLTLFLVKLGQPIDSSKYGYWLVSCHDRALPGN